MSGVPIDLGSNPLSFHVAWSGFYKKTLKERQAQLSSLLSIIWPQTTQKKVQPCRDSRNERQITTSSKSNAFHVVDGVKPLLPREDVEALETPESKFADMMIENCIGTLSLPVGLGLNFTINGKPFVVPMCVEESSVIAATSGAAKTISFHNGFACSTSERNLITAQVQLYVRRDNLDKAISDLEKNRSEIVQRANQFCQGMVKRGGGVVSISFKKIIAPESYSENSGVDLIPDEKDPGLESGSWIVVNLGIDTCEAMGANCASSVAEGVSSHLANVAGGTVGVCITSNFSRERLATASFCIPVDATKYKQFSGRYLARKIVESNIWAACDITRATTHNKGIMNGVDAVALSIGQDWRAIEAAAHAFATVKDPNSPYAPLTDYWIDKDSTNCSYNKRTKVKSVSTDSDPLYLHGSLTLPLQVGTKGGALSMNKAYVSCIKILGLDMDSKKIAQVMVAVGLAQNFAALRALCTEGIQVGHMALHAQNIAVHANVPEDKIPDCISYMKKSGAISVESAKNYLESIKNK